MPRTSPKVSTKHAISLPRGIVLAAGRQPEVVAFEERLIEFFTEAAEILGIPKSVAAIYGVVFASAVPLSFADVEMRLNISKGSISQGLRLLREVGALQGVSASSSRVEFYTPDLELRKLVRRFLENRLEKQLTAGRAKLIALNRSLPTGYPDSAELKRRLNSLTAWNRKARALLPLARISLRVG